MKHSQPKIWIHNLFHSCFDNVIIIDKQFTIVRLQQSIGNEYFMFVRKKIVYL